MSVTPYRSTLPVALRAPVSAATLLKLLIVLAFVGGVIGGLAAS
jgi:hypothetical protein